MLGMSEIAQTARPAHAPRRRRRVEPAPPAREPVSLVPWLQAQAINVTRHAAALRPFQKKEFGSGVAAPSEGHIQAVNALITTLRADLLKLSKRVTEAVNTAVNEPQTAALQNVVKLKERAHDWVRAIE